MTYNCCIVSDSHSVCYQNYCKQKEKRLWMSDSEMIPSLCYWLFHLCWWICWHCTSQEHSLCTDPKTCLPNFQSVGSVSIMISIVKESFSLHRSKDLLANFPKCWFCLNPGFKSNEIIFIMYIFLDDQVQQMYWSVCKIKNVYAKLLILLPNIWSMIFLPLLKNLYGIESHILQKATCSQIFQHFVFVPQLVLKMILSISQSLVKTFEGYSARTQQIFLIDGPLICGIGYIDVSLISVFFSSIFDCWVIFDNFSW